MKEDNDLSDDGDEERKHEIKRKQMAKERQDKFNQNQLKCSKGAGKAHMMRKIKDVKDLDMKVVMS
jgi:hypothetical protein